MNDFMGIGGLVNGGMLLARGRDVLAHVKTSWQPKESSVTLALHS